MINNCIATSYRLTILSYSRINNRCFFANTKNPSPWTCFIDCRSRGWMFYRSRIKFGMTTAWRFFVGEVFFLQHKGSVPWASRREHVCKETSALREPQRPLSPWTWFRVCRCCGWMFYRSRIKFGMTAWMVVLRWRGVFLQQKNPPPELIEGSMYAKKWRPFDRPLDAALRGRDRVAVHGMYLAKVCHPTSVTLNLLHGL